MTNKAHEHRSEEGAEADVDAADVRHHRDRLVPVDYEHDDGEHDHADDLEEHAGVVDERDELDAVDVEDRDDDEGDRGHPDLVVQARGVGVPSHVVERRKSVSGKVTTTAVTVIMPANTYIHPVNQAYLLPARYLVHWKTDPAMGKWLETSAKLSATMNWPARDDRPAPDEHASSGDAGRARTG